MYRALLASIYGLIALGAGQIFLSSLPGAEIRYIGNRIDRGEAIERTVVARLALDTTESAKTCDGETLRSLRSIVLLHLDQQNQSVDYDAWLAAFTAAREQFLHALSCAPADGATWAAYAMVEASIAADPALLNRLLELSLWTAPVERAALFGRFKARRIAGEAVAPEITAALEEDSRTAVLYLPPQEVAKLADSSRRPIARRCSRPPR